MNPAHLLGGVLVGIALANGAEASTDELSSAITEACSPAPPGTDLPAGANGTVSSAALRKAVLEAYSLTPGLLIDESAPGLVAKAMTASAASTSDDRKLWNLKRRIDEWLNGGDRLADDGVKVRDAASLASSPVGGSQAALMAIFSGKSDTVVFYCTGKAPDARMEAPSDANHFALTQKKDDLVLGKISEKSHAQFAFTDDRQARAQSYGLKLAAGWVLPSKRTFVTPQVSLMRTGAFYVAYDRSGSNNPAVDNYANNLNLGFDLSGDIQTAPPNSRGSYWALNFAHETDDDFRSSANSAEFRLEPDLAAPGQYVFQTLGQPAGWPAEFRWSVEGVADWRSIDDPGEKKKLVDGAEYARLGYDLGLDFRFGPPMAEWRLQWSNSYQLRDGQTEDGGDAQMFSSTLSLLASKTSAYALSLSYERGENLQSFETSEIWKLTLGLRH